MPILLLAPSEGLGGGIERYLATLEDAFVREGVEYSRLNLMVPGYSRGWKARIRLAARIARVMRSATSPVRLVLGHRDFLPLVPLAAWFSTFSGASVILHGSEIWSRGRRGRRVMRRADVRVIAVSNFSAGALIGMASAAVLPPGLTTAWFDTLVQVGRARSAPHGPGVRVLTVFRLSQWSGKGFPVLVEALDSIGLPTLELVLCGSGSVPEGVEELAARHHWITVKAGLSDQALAQEFARADVFVLATRTRTDAEPSGEGFGLVLIESQLAGTCVVAPAFGGSGDAFHRGVTGVAPVDESAEALARVLNPLLTDRELRQRMSLAAHAWAAANCDPTQYSRMAVATLT